MKDKTLEAHVKNNTVAPSYLLIDRDILKLRRIAEWFSKSYNTADIFRLESTPNILVKETEEFIARAHLAAVDGKKLFIICDAATMTIAAQNKILKTIEDTPADTTFMLLASSATPVLNTIKSRCVTIYPDPVSNTPSATSGCHPFVSKGNFTLSEVALIDSNPRSQQIFGAVEKILTQCKTLDDALPHLPLLAKKENLQITLIAFNHYLSPVTCHLSPEKRYSILKKLSIINRNIAAGCNSVNAFDLLLIELF